MIFTSLERKIAVVDLGGGRPLCTTNFFLSGRKITVSAPSICPDVAPKIEKNYHFRPKPTY